MFKDYIIYARLSWQLGGKNFSKNTEMYEQNSMDHLTEILCAPFPHYLWYRTAVKKIKLPPFEAE